MLFFFLGKIFHTIFKKIISVILGFRGIFFKNHPDFFPVPQRSGKSVKSIYQILSDRHSPSIIGRATPATKCQHMLCTGHRKKDMILPNSSLIIS